MAVRQVYMRREATHFSKVCAIIARATDPEVREFIDVLKNNWHFALVSPMGLSDGDKGYGGRQVFETWLYTRGLHWDPRRQPDAERLDKMDALLLPTHVVQCVTRGLAVCILQLDFAVADALGELPLADTEQLAATERRFAFKIADPAT